MDTQPVGLTPEPPRSFVGRLWKSFGFLPAVLHPLPLMLAYFFIIDTPLWRPGEDTNTGQPYLPLFLPILAGLCLARFAIWRAAMMLLRRPTPPGGFWAAFQKAHASVWFFVPFGLRIVFGSMEGNVLGFVVLPLLLALTVLFTPWVLFRLLRRQSAGKPPAFGADPRDERGTT